MNLPPLPSPEVDPTPIFEFYRGSYGSELLTAAVAEFDLFNQLVQEPQTFYDLRNTIGLEERPAMVLITAMRAFGLIEQDNSQRLRLTPLAREHLVPGGVFDVRDYIGLAADSPGVHEMVKRLRTNKPAGSGENDEEGVAFMYKDGVESAMERETSARFLTMALAGRAKNVAPVLAEQYPLDSAEVLMDIGGGTGIYSIAYLRRFPNLRAIVIDRPEVLKITEEMAEEYGVTDRLSVHPGDMFSDPIPQEADVILLSNVLHDWDVPECKQLIQRCADELPSGGHLLIHDVFLNDTMDGPIPIALYSAALFTLTEGRAYSAAEYRSWLETTGLIPGEITETLIHCGVLPATKRPPNH